MTNGKNGHDRKHEGARILIIDDLKLDLKLMRILLTGEGYDVKAAAGAGEALAILETFRPQLVVVDVNMGEISGLELTRTLKASPETHGIVVIAVTAYNLEEAARAAGCDDFIAKPIDIASFSQAIDRQLGDRQRKSG